MKSVILDTNLLIDLFEKQVFLPQDFNQYDNIVLPATVIGEYRAGLFDTKKGEENKQKLAYYLSRSTVSTVPITDRTAEIYAKVYQALRTIGRMIPQNDMWIAASALEHGADLATKDEHFRLVPMLTTIVVQNQGE
jgi:predicted nucleic acid-binding protein